MIGPLAGVVSAVIVGVVLDGFEDAGTHGDEAIFVVFALSDVDEFLVKMDVFELEVLSFAFSEAAAITEV